MTPAVFLVILAVKLLKRYETSIPVQGFLAGMRPASFGLVLSAAVIFAELSVFRTAIPWGEFWKLLTGAGGTFGNFGVNWGCVIVAAATVPILFASCCATGVMPILMKTKFSFIRLLLISALFGALFCR